MAFVQRALGFTLQLGMGSFGNSGFNTVTVPSGLWATALINKVGSPARNSAQIEIAGLPLPVINKFSAIGLQAGAFRNNVVTVTAGTAGGAMPIVFSGGMMEAYPDFETEAEATFRIHADSAVLPAMKPASATSYSGSVDVKTLMMNLAGQMGYTLEANNVSAQLNNPHYSGTLRNQAIEAADDAGIYVHFEDDTKTLVICPKTAARNTQVPTISPQTGMISYPSFVGPGKIAVETEYNPNLRFLGNILVQNSIITGANGNWRVIDLKHDLSTHPNGPWFSQIRADNIGGASS